MRIEPLWTSMVPLLWKATAPPTVVAPAPADFLKVPALVNVAGTPLPLVMAASDRASKVEPARLLKAPALLMARSPVPVQVVGPAWLNVLATRPLSTAPLRFSGPVLSNVP